MTKPLYEIDAFIDMLKQQRDELIVQMNLAKAEARDEWNELEGKLEHLKAKADTVRHEAGEAADDVLEATKLVAEEIKRGYDRIRKKL